MEVVVELGGSAAKAQRLDAAGRRRPRPGLPRASGPSIPAWRARRAGVTALVHRLRRALEARRAALVLVADADRRAAETTARLVELGEPVSRVAARVGLPAAALRRTLREHQLSESAAGSAGEPSQNADDVGNGVHEDV